VRRDLIGVYKIRDNCKLILNDWYFDDETIKEIAEDYKNYLEKRKDNDDEDNFSDFIIDYFDNGFSMNWSWDLEASNVEELHDEIKKYM
jgi:hypothetical protein